MKSVPKLYDIRSFGILAFRIRWTNFRNLYIEWKGFGCRWSIWTSFLISQGMLPWQPIFGKICEMTFIHFKTGYTIVMWMHALIAPLIALHRVKMVKIGLVVFELKWGRKWKLCCDSVEIGRYTFIWHTGVLLSLIHIWRCRRSTLCRSRWSPYH